MLHQCLDNIGITSQNSLIQRQLFPRIDTNFSPLENDVQNGKILKPSGFQQINEEILFLDQDVQVIVVILNQSAHGFNI